MSSSDISPLSSAPSDVSDNELTLKPPLGKLDQYFKHGPAAVSPSPAKRKRPASPPHDYVLADNPDIAVSIYMDSSCEDKFKLTIICVANQISRSSSLCFVRASAAHSRSPYHTMALKI